MSNNKDKVREYFDNFVSNKDYPIHKNEYDKYDLTTEHWKKEALRAMRLTISSIEQPVGKTIAINCAHNNELTKEALDMYTLCIERDQGL